MPVWIHLEVIALTKESIEDVLCAKDSDSCIKVHEDFFTIEKLFLDALVKLFQVAIIHNVFQFKHILREVRSCLLSRLLMVLVVDSGRSKPQILAVFSETRDYHILSRQYVILSHVGHIHYPGMVCVF